MKILCLDNTAVSYRLEQENQTTVVKTGKYINSKGIPINENLNRHIDSDSYDFVLAPHNYCGSDYLRSRGCFVFGGGLFARTLEENEEYNRQIRELAELPDVPENEVYGLLWNGEEGSAHYKVVNYSRCLDHDLGMPHDSVACRLSLQEPEHELDELYKILKQSSYRGVVYYDATGIYCSFIPEHLYALLELAKEGIHSLLYAIASGRKVECQFYSSVSVAVRVSMYPYPPLIPERGIPVKGLTEPALRHVWVEGLVREDDKWITSGENGRLLIVTGRGKNHYQASKRVYRAIEMLDVPFIQYRTDIAPKIF